MLNPIGLIYLEQTSLILSQEQGQTRSLLIEDQSSLNKEIHEHEPFGTNLVWHDFDGVSDEKTRPSNVVKHAMEEDEEYDGFARS